MPCNDISEYVEVELDPEDRLRGFALRKGTCGAGIGDATLPDLLQHATLDELLAQPVSYWAAQLGPQHRFVREKQLHALHAALAVYAGQSSGALGERFTVSHVEWGEEGLRLTGMLSLDIPAADVPGCKTCGSCRSQ